MQQLGLLTASLLSMSKHAHRCTKQT